MCYLNAAFQMLLSVPEIPAFFKEKSEDDIDNLRIVDANQTVDYARYRKHLKLLKILFNKINEIQLNTQHIETMALVGVDGLDKRGQPYINPTLECDQKDKAYMQLVNTSGGAFLNEDKTSAVCFFSGASGVFWLSIVAKNGNALGSANAGNAHSGTNNLSVFINSTGAISVSTTSAGTTRWSIVLLPSS